MSLVASPPRRCRAGPKASSTSPSGAPEFGSDGMLSPNPTPRSAPTPRQPTATPSWRRDGLHHRSQRPRGRVHRPRHGRPPVLDLGATDRVLVVRGFAVIPCVVSAITTTTAGHRSGRRRHTGHRRQGRHLRRRRRRQLKGLGGADTLYGLGGADRSTAARRRHARGRRQGRLLVGDPHGRRRAMLLRGGQGVDLVRYGHGGQAPSRRHELGQRRRRRAYGEDDYIGDDIEKLVGGRAADDLTATTLANTIFGGAGGDTISGRGNRTPCTARPGSTRSSETTTVAPVTGSTAARTAARPTPIPRTWSRAAVPLRSRDGDRIASGETLN